MKDVPSALQPGAHCLPERDEFLTNSQALLSRLFYGSYDTRAVRGRARLVRQGRRAFPRELHVHHVSPVADDRAGCHARHRHGVAAFRRESIHSPHHSSARIGQMIVGGVIGRHAKTLAAGPQQDCDARQRSTRPGSAQGDRKVDPEPGAAGLPRVMLAQFGDNDAGHLAAHVVHQRRIPTTRSASAATCTGGTTTSGTCPRSGRSSIAPSSAKPRRAGRCHESPLSAPP